MCLYVCLSGGLYQQSYHAAQPGMALPPMPTIPRNNSSPAPKNRAPCWPRQGNPVAKSREQSKTPTTVVSSKSSWTSRAKRAPDFDPSNQAKPTPSDFTKPSGHPGRTASTSGNPSPSRSTKPRTAWTQDSDHTSTPREWQTQHPALGSRVARKAHSPVCDGKTFNSLAVQEASSTQAQSTKSIWADPHRTLDPTPRSQPRTFQSFWQTLAHP